MFMGDLIDHSVSAMFWLLFDATISLMLIFDLTLNGFKILLNL